MECNVVQSVISSQLSAISSAEAYIKLIPHAVKLESVLRRWSGFPVTAMAFGNDRLLVNAYVFQIKEIQPLLEFLEVGLNCNFDDTQDVAGAHLAFRSFTARDCSWLRVDANLQADGPGCHKVKVGMTEPQPIYEIRCLAEVDAPLALEGGEQGQLPAPAPALAGPENDDDMPF